MRVVKEWHRLPRNVVGAPSLEIFEVSQDSEQPGLLEDVPLPMALGVKMIDLERFLLNYSMMILLLLSQNTQATPEMSLFLFSSQHRWLLLGGAEMLQLLVPVHCVMNSSLLLL